MQQRIRQYKSLLVESYLTPFTPEHGHFPCSCLCFPSTLFRRLVCHGGHLKIICSNSFASALLITRLNISSACRHVPDRLFPTGAMPGTLLSSSTDDRPRKTHPSKVWREPFWRPILPLWSNVCVRVYVLATSTNRAECNAALCAC